MASLPSCSGRYFPLSYFWYDAPSCNLLVLGTQDDETKLCCSCDHFQTKTLVILDTVWPVLLCDWAISPPINIRKECLPSAAKVLRLQFAATLVPLWPFLHVSGLQQSLTDEDQFNKSSYPWPMFPDSSRYLKLQPVPWFSLRLCTYDEAEFVD